jgi:HSP20 family molecular chaperone IbpA
LLNSLPQQQQQTSLNQTAASPEQPNLFVFSPAPRQLKVDDSNNKVLPFTSGEPTIFVIDPALQKRVKGNQQWPNATPSVSPTPSPTPSVPQRPVHGGTKKENHGDVVATLRLPEGVTANDLKVRVRNNVLSVTGKKNEVTADSVNLTTSFSRQWTLDDDIDTDNVKAVIEQDGVLVITAPKKNKVKEIVVAHVKESIVDKEKHNLNVGATKPETTASKKDEAVATRKKENNHRSPSPPSPSKKKVSAPTKDTAVHHDVSFELRITQNDNANLVVTVPVPDGVSPNDLTIEVKDRVLNIAGVQRKEADGSVITTKFERHLVLDDRVETEKATASFDAEKRVLTVAAPKKPPLVKPPQKISINITSPPPKEQSVVHHEVTTAPSEDTTNKESSIVSETKDHTTTTSAEDYPDNSVKIAVQEQESPEGTKVVVETVAEE